MKFIDRSTLAPWSLTETRMVSSLPPELLDLIVDHLRDEPIALKACCLISKSWLHRTRSHIFADVKFDGRSASIESWMRAFPDPSSSPAHYARSLSICDLKSVTAAVTDARTWIHSFRHLVHLGVDTNKARIDPDVSLVPLQRLSPTLKSLHLHCRYISLPVALALICSFPLLEDLKVVCISIGGNTDRWNTPTSPKFTGRLALIGRVDPIARGLLDLPGGLHFTKIKVWCPDHHAKSVMGLVSRCSGTLEYLCINFGFFSGGFCPYSVVDKCPTTTL